MESKLEMVTCPICHNLFPKRRRELGYNYCVNCSTEKRKVAFIQGVSEGEGGDGVVTDVSIVTAEEASTLERSRKNSEKISKDDSLDMTTLEEHDQDGLSEDEFTSLRKISLNSEDEEIFSEKVMDEMEEFCDVEEEEEEYDTYEEEEE